MINSWNLVLALPLEFSKGRITKSGERELFENITEVISFLLVFEGQKSHINWEGG